MKRIKTGILLVMVLCIAFAKPVYANSSWLWVTDKQPWQLLPSAIIATLLIESLMHKYILNIKSIKVYMAIIIANLCSYLLPYVLFCWMNYDQVGYTVMQSLSSGPTYMVGIGYLIMTLAIEIPIVRGMINEFVEDRKKGLLVTVISNTITTALVFVIERIVCQGRW